MKHLILFLTAALSVAAAQTASPSVSLPGTVPASVSRKVPDALGKFLSAGGEVRLIGAGGTVIGTLNGDSTVTLAVGATLADVKSVQVVPPAGRGEPTTYTLARDLSKPGAIKFEVRGPNGQVQSLPLSAIVNRQAETKAAKKDQDQAEDEASEKEKAEKPEKGEGAEHPGKGKGGKGK